MEVFVDWTTLIIKIVGGVIIFIGVVEATFYFFKLLFKRRLSDNMRGLDEIRLEFGRYILLGLEFFIAADIFQTIFMPSWSELGQLGVIVIIRTILSYFLNHEFKYIEKGRLRR